MYDRSDWLFVLVAFAMVLLLVVAIIAFIFGVEYTVAHHMCGNRVTFAQGDFTCPIPLIHGGK